MAKKPVYKFKPYTPTKFKKIFKDDGLDETSKTIQSLEKQKANLDERLRAEGIDPKTLGGEFDNRNIIEKALNLTPDQGLLMDFFEIIDRPVQAVKGAITSGVDNETFFEGFIKGLTGEKEQTGREALKKFNIDTSQAPGILKFGVDVGTDILLDPLTYLPPGLIAKGISSLGKLGSKTITVAGEEIVSNTARIVKDTIKRANAGDAVARAAIKNADEMDEIIQESVRYMQGKAPGVEAERLAKNLYDDSIKSYLKANGIVDDGKYLVTLQGAQKEGARNLKDLTVYYKQGDNTYVRIAKTEVKDVLGKAFAFKGAFNLGDLTATVARSNGAEFYRRLKASGIKTRAGESLEPLIRKALKGERGGLTNFFSKKFFDEDSILKVEGIVKDVLFDDLQKSGIKNMTFRVGKDKVITLSLANARKYVKITSAKITKNTVGSITNKAVKGVSERIGVVFKKLYRTAKGKKNYGKLATSLDGVRKFRVGTGVVLVDGIDDLQKAKRFVGEIFETAKGKSVKITDVGVLEDGTVVLKGTNVGKNLDEIRSALDLFDPETGKKMTLEALTEIDETEAFVSDLLNQKTTTGPTTTEVITLAGRARAGEFGQTIQSIAQSLKKFEIDFRLTFNLTAGLDDKAKALIKRAYGENMFELERRSTRLAEIKRKLIAKNPESGTLLGEILEADARIIDGAIVKLKRRMGTSDFFDYVLKRVQDGTEIVLPSFPTEAAKRNFLSSINKLYRNAFSTTDDIFSVVVGKNGGTVLKVNGSASDVKELLKYIVDAPLTGRRVPNYLQFGEKALSAKAKAFLRNNIKAIDEYKQLSNEILDELIDVAGFDNLPRELAGQIGYMRHIMSREAFEGLQRQLPGALSIYAKPGRDTLAKRTFLGSAQEVNAAMKDFYGLTDNLFDPNAFNAMEDLIKVAQRKLDQKRVLDIILTNKGIDARDLIKVVDNTQEARRGLGNYDVMFKDFKEEFGALYKNLSPEAQKTLDAFLAGNGYNANKAIQMNKSAYNVLKGAEKAYVDIPKLVTIYDKFLNTWKGLTLVTPGFHMRNLFGNMFNSYAVGMDIAAQGKYLTTAMQEMDQFQKIGKKLAQGLEITQAEQKIFDTVKGYFEQGVSQTHRGIRDLESVMESVARVQKAGRLKNTYNNVIRFNFNVAEKMDDIQRYALYRWGLDTTGDATKAANTVAEALFDYSHLSPFEKNTMKRLFPFYTFMKNNFVFQAKNIFKNPKQYARLGRAYNYALEDLGGYSPQDLPDYATENMWLPIPMTVNKNDKEAISFLKANLPLSDFTELVENPFKKGVVSITAPVKLLIEFGAGRDLFTGQPLEAFPGQKNAMEEGTGVFSGLRDKRGNLTITQSPLFQKILNDLGLRAPINFASTGLDLVDTLAGYQGSVENFGDFLQRMGLAGVQERDRLKLSSLYQDLEKLRELKKFYEQETGNQLPVLPRG